MVTIQTTAYDSGDPAEASISQGQWLSADKWLLKTVRMLRLPPGYYPDQDWAMAAQAVRILGGEVVDHPEIQESSGMIDEGPAPISGERSLRFNEGEWVTINGEHVYIEKGTDKILIGPKGLVGKTKDHLTKMKVDKLHAALVAWQYYDPVRDKEIGNPVAEAREAAVKGDDSNPIVKAIRSETIDKPVYRGMIVQQTDPIASWKKGQTVQILPSSFSTDKLIAYKFANGYVNTPEEKATGTPLLVQIEKSDNPAHGIEIGGRGDARRAEEAEVITGGTFKVDIVEDIKGLGIGPLHVVQVHQIGVF